MLFFHLYPNANYSLNDRFLTNHCFARTDLNLLKEVNIRGVGAPHEIGGMSPEDFAEKFTTLFNEEYRNEANKDAIRRMNIIFDEMMLTDSEQTLLLQRIANSLFIRGFKNIVISSVMIANRDVSKPVYFELNEDMTAYSAFYGDRLKDHSLHTKPAELNDTLRKLELTTVQTEYEKRKVTDQIDLLQHNLKNAKDLIAARTLVENQDLKATFDRARNQIVPYPEIIDETKRIELQKELNGYYLSRKQLQEEVANARKSLWRWFGAGSIPEKLKQIEELTKRLASHPTLKPLSFQHSDYFKL